MSIQLSALDSRLATLMGDSGDVYADDRTAAINNAGRELYPILFKPLVDETVTTVVNQRLYELPSDFQGGHLSQVWLRASETSPYRYYEIFGWNIENDEGTKSLKIPYLLLADRTFKLIGYCPLEDDLSLDADPMSIDAEKANLLLYQAAALIMQTKMGVVGRDDVSRYERQFLFYSARVEQLKPRMRMSRPSGQIRWSA